MSRSSRKAKLVLLKGTVLRRLAQSPFCATVAAIQFQILRAVPTENPLSVILPYAQKSPGSTSFLLHRNGDTHCVSGVCHSLSSVLKIPPRGCECQRLPPFQGQVIAHVWTDGPRSVYLLVHQRTLGLVSSSGERVGTRGRDLPLALRMDTSHPGRHPRDKTWAALECMLQTKCPESAGRLAMGVWKTMTPGLVCAPDTHLRRRQRRAHSP